MELLADNDCEVPSAARYERLESASFAFLLALEHLTPQQRAVLVLRDVLDYSVDETAAALGISNDEAKKVLLGEKEPSMQFTTPDELGELAVFFCSPAGNNVRGVAWNMDGGWVAQ